MKRPPEYRVAPSCANCYNFSPRSMRFWCIKYQQYVDMYYVCDEWRSEGDLK